MKHFKCEYYEVDAPEKCCLFCKHCHDVFYDWSGPYAYGCELTNSGDNIFAAHWGWQENCENFEGEEE